MAHELTANERAFMASHIRAWVNYPAQLAHRLKGATSHALRGEFPALKSRLPSLWTNSYYVGTAGNVSSETIRRYIEAQKGQ